MVSVVVIVNGMCQWKLQMTMNKKKKEKNKMKEKKKKQHSMSPMNFHLGQIMKNSKFIQFRQRNGFFLGSFFYE